MSVTFLTNEDERDILIGQELTEAEKLLARNAIGANEKTHWDTRVTEWVAKLPEGTYSSEEGEYEISNMDFTELGSTFPLSRDYLVSWNGVDYECTAKVNPSNDQWTAVGNLVALGGADTGEPFVIYRDERGMYAYAKAVDGTTSDVTIKIMEKSSTGELVKLDNKYLDLDWVPAPIREMIVSERMFNSGDTISDFKLANFTTGEETVAVYYDGNQYLCKLQGFKDGLDSWYWIGNGAILEPNAFPNTGEPFLIGLLDKRDSTIYFSESGEHTVAIYFFNGYNVIPKEFLPEGFPYPSASGGGGKLLPETTLVGEESGEAIMFMFESPVKIEGGKTYTVNWNGTEYSCTALDNSFEDGGEIVSLILLGNYGLMMSNSGTGEPFVIAYSIEDGMETTFAYGLDGSHSVTISIAEGGGTTRMSEDLLPASVESVVIRSSTEGSTKKFKITVDDSGAISATEV